MAAGNSHYAHHHLCVDNDTGLNLFIPGPPEIHPNLLAPLCHVREIPLMACWERVSQIPLTLCFIASWLFSRGDNRVNKA